MTEPTNNNNVLACKAIEDMLEKSKKAQAKFEPGTSQHTLLANRIHALNVSLTLLSREAEQTVMHRYSMHELQSAIAPLTSLIHKSEKARTHLQPDSWQHTMLTSNLKGLNLALEILSDIVDKHQRQD